LLPLYCSFLEVGLAILSYLEQLVGRQSLASPQPQPEPVAV